MYEMKGFIFKEVDGKIQKATINAGIQVSGWDEAKEILEVLDIKHYLFTLKEVK